MQHYALGCLCKEIVECNGLEVCRVAYTETLEGEICHDRTEG